MLWCLLTIIWAALLHSAGPVSGENCVQPLTCMPAAECSSRLGGSAHLFTLFACGQGDAWVCCPQSSEQIKDTSLSNKMSLLPDIEDCVIASDDRIMNGENASLGQFPWMALLGYRLNKEDPLEFRCGGTLINNRYILTAAHCLNAPDKAVLEKVRLNELNLETDPDCIKFINNTVCGDRALDVDIESVVRHEDYNKPFLKNDIGLIRLNRNVTFVPDNIVPICLPFGLTITGFEETNYTVAGWGKQDNYDNQGSSVLQFVSLWTVPLHDCSALQASEVLPLSNTTQLCAGGQPGIDACKGDSGGPLMRYNKSGKVLQVGIVSFGSPYCGRGTPSVYTRVTAYLDWILKNIEP